MPSTSKLAALLGVATLLVSAEAAAWVPIDGSNPVWQIPVSYRVNQGSIPSSISGIAVARIDEGLAEWASPACTFFQAVNAGDTSLGSDYQDGINVFRWQSGSWPQYLGDVNSVIGVTSPVFDSGQMYDADIIFNNVGFCWNDSGGGGCVDTGSIATHEEGHFLGLGHTNVNDSTMVPYYLGGTAQRSIESDDINGVCALYPEGGQAATSSSSGGGGCDVCANDAVAGTCSAYYNACGSSQDCVDFYYCIADCQSNQCVDDCIAAHPSGSQIYIDMSNCICDDCAVECEMECGGSSSSSSSGDAVAASSAVATSASAGVGGAGVGSATSTVGVGAGDSDDDGALKDEDDPSTDADSGCGCRAVGSSPAGTGLALLAGAALIAALGRRRKR